MRTGGFAGALLLAAGLGGCGRHGPGLEDIPRPALVWSQGNGLCGKEVAVDGDGQVWRDQGCETPIHLRGVRVLSSDQVSDLWALFSVLPQRDVLQIARCEGGFSHGFQRLDGPQPPATTALACTTALTYDDVSELPDDFRRLAEALIAVQ